MHGILKTHYTCSREIMTLVAICNLHGIVGMNLTFSVYQSSIRPNFLFAQALSLEHAVHANKMTSDVHWSSKDQLNNTSQELTCNRVSMFY